MFLQGWEWDLVGALCLLESTLLLSYNPKIFVFRESHVVPADPRVASALGSKLGLVVCSGKTLTVPSSCLVLVEEGWGGSWRKAGRGASKLLWDRLLLIPHILLSIQSMLSPGLPSFCFVSLYFFSTSVSESFLFSSFAPK